MKHIPFAPGGEEATVSENSSQNYCLCRHCRPPFKLNDQTKPPTALDMLVVMEELGLHLFSDGRVLFIRAENDRIMSSLPPSYFAAVKSHREWFLQHLRRVPTELLRKIFGSENVDKAIAAS